MNKNIVTQVTGFLNRADVIVTEVCSTLAPWLVPLLSSIVIGKAMMLEPFNWGLPLAILTGAAIELSGIATLNTTMTIWSKRGNSVPFWISFSCSFVYAATAMILTVVLKIVTGLEVLAYAMFVILAVTSAVNLALRRDHQRGQLPRKRTQKTQKRPFVPGDREALDKANKSRQGQIMARRSRVKHLMGEGLSQTEIAAQLDVSPTTIKRDVKSLNGIAG